MNNIISNLFVSLSLIGIMTNNSVYSDLGNDWYDLTNDICNDTTKNEMLIGWQDLTQESKNINRELIQTLHKDGWINPVEQEKITILKDKIGKSYSKISDKLFTCCGDVRMFRSEISNLLDESEKMSLLLDFNILNDLNNNIQDIEEDLKNINDNFDQNIFDNKMTFSEVKNSITEIMNKFSNIVNSTDFNNIKNFINTQEEKISLIRYELNLKINKKINKEQMCKLQRKYNDLISNLIRKCYGENCQNIGKKYSNKNVKPLGNAKIQLKKILNEDSNIESNLNIGKIEDAKKEIYEIKKSMRKINEQQMKDMKSEYHSLYINNMKYIVSNYAKELLYWKQSITNIEETYALLKSINNQVKNLDIELSNKTNKEQNITQNTKKSSGIFNRMWNFVKG